MWLVHLLPKLDEDPLGVAPLVSTVMLHLLVSTRANSKANDY